MTGANWVAEKINVPDEFKGIEATVVSENVVLVNRSNKPSAHIGVVPTAPRTPSPIVSLDDVRKVHEQNSTIAMMIAIPRAARWSGAAMRWLQAESVSFGGVKELLSAISYDDDISTHRSKTFAFVDDGLRRHSRVLDLEWLDSKIVKIKLKNDAIVTVALDDNYDVTMDVARQAARTLGNFDVLLKINPNGSITASGAENIERLGFETFKWGELFGYLAKRGGQASYDDIRKRLRKA